MPSYLPVTAETINYAFAVFAGFLIIAITWYSIWGHKGFKGPLASVISVSVMDGVSPMD